MFKIPDKGIILAPCEIKEKSSYTEEEWKKIEKLVEEKGKVYKSSEGCLKAY
ncbi:MAG: hypothetical protein ACOC5U_02845 [Candidatus Aminicenantaceae bacterium]